MSCVALWPAVHPDASEASATSAASFRIRRSALPRTVRTPVDGIGEEAVAAAMCHTGPSATVALARPAPSVTVRAPLTCTDVTDTTGNPDTSVVSQRKRAWSASPEAHRATDCSCRPRRRDGEGPTGRLRC